MAAQMRKRLACLLSVCRLLFSFIPVVICGMQGDVQTEENTKVDFGKMVTLKCALRKQSDVLQVTWQKKTGAGQDNVATYSSKQGVKVNNGYRDRLNITLLELNETAITFFTVTFEDQGYYQCLFNTFPEGSIQGSTYLSITGDVQTEENTKVDFGKMVTLKCALRKQSDVLQVTWQKNTGAGQDNVATYSSKQGVKVNNGYRDRLNITLLELNETAITFFSVTFEDEGYYQCLFNTFPEGSIQGSTYLSITGDVATENRIVGEVGTSVVLKCVLRKPLDVLQITWLKNTSEAMVNLATYSPKAGANINKKYTGHLNITLLALNETTITLWRASIQDEGCYQCLFNSIPSSSVSGTTCLSLYGHLQVFLHYYNSSDHLNVTCLATSWPAPVLWWPGMEEVIQNGSSKVKNSNGTVTVSSWILLNSSPSLQGTNITCGAQHRWSKDLRTITVNESRKFHMPTIVIFLAVTLVLTVMY